MPPRVTASRIAYENPWTRLREDRLLHPDGREGLYGVVERPDFAVVLPLHADGRIEVVAQWRHPLGRRSVELPQGAAPPGERSLAPEDLARMELAEETGLRARDVRHLGRLNLSPGLSGQAFDAFLATGLTRGATAREATEADMTTHTVDPDELAAMIADGRLTDSHSVSTLALAAMRGLLALPSLS